MNKVPLEDYNLAWTLLGGQGFTWDYFPEEDYYIGAMQKMAIKLKHKDGELYWQTYPEKDRWNYVEKYLRLDEDYDQILHTISKDDHIKAAIAKYPAMRILKQDLEEALLGFIISPQNNIKSIRASIRAMSRDLGHKVDVDGVEVYLFPETERIAEANLNKLLGFSLGFHAKFLKGAAKFLQEKQPNQEGLAEDENKARDFLKSIKGIGDKVADCILVYSLGFNNITPLDVWGLRIVHDLYGLDPKLKYAEKRKWLEDYFEGYAAWAGQFLFEYIRGFDPIKVYT